MIQALPFFYLLPFTFPLKFYKFSNHFCSSSDSKLTSLRIFPYPLIKPSLIPSFLYSISKTHLFILKGGQKLLNLSLKSGKVCRLGLLILMRNRLMYQLWILIVIFLKIRDFFSIEWTLFASQSLCFGIYSCRGWTGILYIFDGCKTFSIYSIHKPCISYLNLFSASSSGYTFSASPDYLNQYLNIFDLFHFLYTFHFSWNPSNYWSLSRFPNIGI